jgi:lysophospholipase L1-like esterase
MASTSTLLQPSLVERRTVIRWLIAGLLAALLGALLAAATPSTAHASGVIGPKQYYLGLGDSLAFGFQPNLNWTHGYVQQWYNGDLKNRGESLTNFGCNGETSNTFINGGCPYAYALHNYYLGSQLSAAELFLALHPGQVSPVSLDIGANDLLPDINRSTCTVSSTWATDLATVDNNVTQTILPGLLSALKDSHGNLTGDLVMMNYYDPFQNLCPNTVPYIQQINQHLSADAAKFGVRIVDVYSAFGGSTVPDPNTCTYTWICSIYHDIHATSTGYGVIATTFKNGIGY